MHPFYAAIPDSTHAIARCAPLTGLQVLSATGPDSIEFLHGQLTQDLQGQAPNTASLSGYCTAKGRLLATMVMWRAAGVPDADTPSFHAMVRSDVATPLVKRLGMFVLRAKVKLALASLHVAGVWDVTDPAALAAAAGGPLPQAPWQRVDLPTGTWIAAPSVQGNRWWWIASDAQLDELEDPASAMLAGLRLGDPGTWHAADLAAGVPWVGLLTQDMFIPQTLNLDLIGGVSFTKGCYPGQEVVARSHYRGTVKRRMAYGVIPGHSADSIAAGVDVYDPTQPGEPCGRIVDAAGATDAAVLFETTLTSLAGSTLRLGALDGPAIELRPLPYSLT